MKLLQTILLFLSTTSVISGEEECKILPKSNV